MSKEKLAVRDFQYERKYRLRIQYGKQLIENFSGQKNSEVLERNIWESFTTEGKAFAFYTKARERFAKDKILSLVNGN